MVRCLAIWMKVAMYLLVDDKTFDFLERFSISLFVFKFLFSHQWMDFFLVLRNGFFTIFPVSVVSIISVTISKRIIDVRSDGEVTIDPKYVNLFSYFFSSLVFFFWFNFVGFIILRKIAPDVIFLCFIYLKFSSCKQILNYIQIPDKCLRMNYLLKYSNTKIYIRFDLTIFQIFSHKLLITLFI